MRAVHEKDEVDPGDLQEKRGIAEESTEAARAAAVATNALADELDNWVKAQQAPQIDVIASRDSCNSPLQVSVRDVGSGRTHDSSSVADESGAEVAAAATAAELAEARKLLASDRELLDELEVGF